MDDGTAISIGSRSGKRVLQRPDVVGAMTNCVGKTLEEMLGPIGRSPMPRKVAKKKAT